MKQLFFLLLLSVALFGCKKPDIPVIMKVVVHDTVCVLPGAYENYEDSFPIFEAGKKRLYQIVKETTLYKHNNPKYQRRMMPSSIIRMMLYPDKMLNETVVLFFLKLYHSNLQGDMYGYNVPVTADSECDPYLLLFQYQYYKISKTVGPLHTSYVYLWVLNQPDYLRNPDIKAEVDAITEYRNRHNTHKNRHE